MANVPAPKLKAEDFAAQHGEPDAAGEHKISTIVAIVLVLWAVILDVADYFGAGEVFITDLLCVVTIDIYLLYEGFSPVRMFGGQALELLPFADLLPGYTVGVVFTIIQDRSATAAAIANKIPSKKPVGRLAATAGQAPSKIRDFSARAIAATEKGVKKAQDLQARVPGPLRSVPGRDQADNTSTPQRQNAFAMSATPQRNVLQSVSDNTVPSPTQDTKNPFMAAYRDLESRTLPSLQEILESEVDVTGEKAAEAAAKAAAGGPNVPKQVQ